MVVMMIVIICKSSTKHSWKLIRSTFSVFFLCPFEFFKSFCVCFIVWKGSDFDTTQQKKVHQEDSVRCNSQLVDQTANFRLIFVYIKVRVDEFFVELRVQRSTWPQCILRPLKHSEGTVISQIFFFTVWRSQESPGGGSVSVVLLQCK